MTTAVEVAEKGHQLAAWVNFDGTLAMTENSSYGPDAPPAAFSSPNPIRAAYNVDYIIDRGTGKYEIHYENEMPDEKYSVICSGKGSDNNRYTGLLNDPTTTSCSVYGHYHQDNAYQDMSVMCVAIFRLPQEIQ